MLLWSERRSGWRISGSAGASRRCRLTVDAPITASSNAPRRRACRRNRSAPQADKENSLSSVLH